MQAVARRRASRGLSRSDVVSCLSSLIYAYMAYYLPHRPASGRSPVRASSQAPAARTSSRPPRGNDTVTRLEGSLCTIIRDIASEEAIIVYHRQGKSDAQAELADLEASLHDFRITARSISDDMSYLRAREPHKFYDPRTSGWYYTPAYDELLREQQDNKESIQAVRGRQREPHQWIRDSEAAITASHHKLITLRARQADYQKQLGKLRTQLWAAEQQAALRPAPQRLASVSIAGSSAPIPSRGTRAPLPSPRASIRTRSQSSRSAGRSARSSAAGRQPDSSKRYEAVANETIQKEKWDRMPPMTFLAAIFGAYGNLFKCSKFDYQQAMAWASAAAKRFDPVLVHQDWLTLINMLTVVSATHTS